MAITSDLQNIRVRLESEQYEALREIAKANERNMTQEIRLAVRRHIYVEQHGAPKGFFGDV